MQLPCGERFHFAILLERCTKLLMILDSQPKTSWQTGCPFKTNEEEALVKFYLPVKQLHCFSSNTQSDTNNNNNTQVVLFVNPNSNMPRNNQVNIGEELSSL